MSKWNSNLKFTLIYIKVSILYDIISNVVSKDFKKPLYNFTFEAGKYNLQFIEILPFNLRPRPNYLQNASDLFKLQICTSIKQLRSYRNWWFPIIYVASIG